MSENLTVIRDNIFAQIEQINEELSKLISKGHCHSARATNLGGQHARLLRTLRVINETIRESEADELQRRMVSGRDEG